MIRSPKTAHFPVTSQNGLPHLPVGWPVSRSKCSSSLEGGVIFRVNLCRFSPPILSKSYLSEALRTLNAAAE